MEQNDNPLPLETTLFHSCQTNSDTCHPVTTRSQLSRGERNIKSDWKLR